MALVETIPNISEGRRPAVIESCGRAIVSGGASLLDVHTDAAHHRSVLTTAGTPDEIETGLMALVDTAVATIDLRTHRGVHPRLGAVDVIPLIPLTHATMAQCIDMARRLAAAIATRHDLPVFLYEEAATRPDRRRLEQVRRGEFEGLASRITEPGGAPDFGPRRPHPTAGATIIGARWPLIAYNVVLDTDRLDVAKRIAAHIRESSGGLPFVKALGVPLADRGVTQVTMNLTRFHDTGMTTVFDAIAAEATRLGVTVRESEIVGLVPAAALPPDPATRLRLRAFDARQVLERRLRDAGRLGTEEV